MHKYSTQLTDTRLAASFPWPERLNQSRFWWSKRWWGGCGISWTICKSFAPHFRQITTPAPHHWIFYRPDALPDVRPTVSKRWRHICSTALLRNFNLHFVHRSCIKGATILFSWVLGQMKKGWGQATGWGQCLEFPSVYWRCWLGDRKDIRPVKICGFYSQWFCSRTSGHPRNGH